MSGSYTPNTVVLTETIKMKPERVFSGLLSIIVRKDSEGDGSDSIDCNYAYYSNWASDPNSVDTDEDYPYKGNKPNYGYTSTTGFSDSRSITGFYDGRTTTSDVTKRLGIGDSEVLLFWVGGSVHLEDFYFPEYDNNSPANAVRSETGNDGKVYYNKHPLHAGCQSFIKSKLIGRMNNAIGCSNLVDLSDPADGADNPEESLYVNPIVQKNYVTPAGPDNTGNRVDLLNPPTEINLLNNGIFHPPSTGGFGLDLSEDDNNTFFTPVNSVSISAKHAAPSVSTSIDTSSGSVNGLPTLGGTENNIWYAYEDTTHDKNSWELSIDVKLWGYEVTPAMGNSSYFRNRINVFFQPFGETSEIQLTS